MWCGEIWGLWRRRDLYQSQPCVLQWEELEMCNLLLALTDGTSWIWWEILNRLERHSSVSLKIWSHFRVTMTVGLRRIVIKKGWSSLTQLFFPDLQKKPLHNRAMQIARAPWTIPAKELTCNHVSHLKYFQNLAMMLRRREEGFLFENANL